MEPIPYGRQFVSDEDIQVVVDALKADYLTQGPRILAFEEAFAEYTGAAFAVAVANGTAALHLCALALNVKKGDKVITSPITFAASANCVRYCGGEVTFCDIDSASYLLDINHVRSLLESVPKGTYQGVIPVDFAGRAVDMEAFNKLAKEYNLWIIEDACHAPGAYFSDSHGQKQLCGNGAFADLSIFSFHPVKHIAAGEGGMITTNDEKLYQKLLKLRTHGITKNAADFQNSVTSAIGQQAEVDSEEYPKWYMEMQDLGYNYRLTDIQSALGHSQLKRANQGLESRRAIAQKYDSAFRGSSFLRGQSGYMISHAYHLYILEVEDRKGLYDYLRTHKIYAQIHYVPCHLMPFYRADGWKEGDFPFAEQYYSRCISLPMYPTLTDEQQDFVINKIKEYYLS